MLDEHLYILDSCAVIALLQHEPGAETIADILRHPENRCIIHAINACEVYYDIYRRSGPDDAASLEEILAASCIHLVETMSPSLWQTAGQIKATWRRVSLADCFALALTLLEQGTLLTCDHHEFDHLAQHGVCPIRFLR